ncbi:hypothetical protein PCCS19_42180 [Paenibacillus sp. CCS19]|nr:hypothetical protein PCCS19_42180 [Paenibacillus cellulosilyticus]
MIGITVGVGSKVVGPLTISSEASLAIGSNCWIGTNLRIHGNGKIAIGDNNAFAPDITIITGSHLMGDSSQRAGKGIHWDYTIGDGNWIGAKSTLSNGVKIENGVMIGACSLVTKNCESDGLYVGLPAKRVRDLPYDREKTLSNNDLPIKLT